MKKSIYAFVILALACLFPPVAHAQLMGETVAYFDGKTELEGYWMQSNCGIVRRPQPTILMIHQWKGITDHEKSRAETLADECFHVFAIDMYGKGVRPRDQDEAAAESAKYKNDPALAISRINAALAFVEEQTKREYSYMDTSDIAVIGYCFGGGIALDFARSGADIDGVVSFHGNLAPHGNPAEAGTVKAALQIHHGAADPYVPQSEVQDFIAEMDAAKVDWQLTQYSGAVHAFTQKNSGDDPTKGVAYDESADRRSWAAMVDFLVEVFED